MHKLRLKGFIGPLGDDIPSLLIVMLALSLFFSALTFTFDSYDLKVRNFQMLKGSMDIARVVTSDGLIIGPLSDLSDEAKPIANSYNLKYSLQYTDGANDAEMEVTNVNCSTVNWLSFDYLVAQYNIVNNDIVLRTLRICVG